MDADWSVELGADDETLEFPWPEQDGLHYVDLKHRPELASSLNEVVEFPELLRALTALNAPASALLTAKCDVWFDAELGPAEKVYEASCRLSAYIDVLFEDERRLHFEGHEQFVKTVAKSVSNSKDRAAIELVVRRCYFQQNKESAYRASMGDVQRWNEGFYVTVYVSGYGDSKAEARSSWASALQVTADAIVRAAGSATT